MLYEWKGNEDGKERMFCFIQHLIPLSNRLVKDIVMYSEMFLEKTNVTSLSYFSDRIFSISSQRWDIIP